MENTYEIKVDFFDEKTEEFIESDTLTIIANSVDDAYDQIEEDIASNLELYPSDYYEANLIDVY